MRPVCVDGSGRSVSASDPKRQVWYSALCSYWTDNWGILNKHHNGIPCCPNCGAPGMMIVFSHFEAGAKELDKAEPGYFKFVMGHKEQCHQRDTGGMMSYWRLYSAMKESTNAEGRGDTPGSTSQPSPADEAREGSSREERWPDT